MTGETVGEVMREKRGKRGWTQLQLSEKTGISQSTLSQIETGARGRPRDQTLMKIFEVLDIPSIYKEGVEGQAIRRGASTLAEIEDAINRYPKITAKAKRNLFENLHVWARDYKQQAKQTH